MGDEGSYQRTQRVDMLLSAGDHGDGSLDPQLPAIAATNAVGSTTVSTGVNHELISKLVAGVCYH